MNNIKGIPFRLGDYNKHAISTSESAIDLGESVCLCHNAGTETIYFSGATGVSSDNAELLPGERIYLAGSVYFVGAGSTTLKVQQLITAYN